MIKSKLLYATLFGAAMVLGACDDSTTTPSGGTATTPQASEQAAEDMKKKTEDASERAKNAAEAAGSEVKKQAEAGSDALKKGADSAASAVATQPAADADSAKLQQVMDYIKEKKWDLAETALKELEAKKASLPAALSGQVDNARKMLDAAKAGLGAVPAAPK